MSRDYDEQYVDCPGEYDPVIPEIVTIKDSGQRREFPTGSVRDVRDGKGRFDLLPCHAIYRIARHFEEGAKKYGDDNWRKGQPLRQYIDSAMRHLFRYLEGHRDEPHDTAAAWNVLALIETKEMIQRGLLPAELDDLPRYVK